MCCCDFVGPLAAYLMEKIHVKFIVILGSVFMLGGAYFSSIMKSWWAFFIIYNCCALGIGIFYWIPVFCAWEWFPAKKGLISGIVIGSIGLGNFAYSLLST
jgi:MFS transporter, OFA family, oxalate/formate antiporter